MRSSFWVMVGVLFCGMMPSSAQAALDRELQQVQGRWRVTDIRIGQGWGEAEAQIRMTLQTIRLVINQDQVSAEIEGTPTGQAARLQVDSRPRPKVANLVTKNADGTEVVLKGIYSLEGGTLKFYFGFEARPAKFPNETGGQDLLITLEREKPQGR
jgi:uncharacterized protein (TIGR03067 family)